MSVDYSHNQRIGSIGEFLAVKYLLKRDHTVVERNYSIAAFGEIDIISIKGDDIFFCEVKTRTSKSHGSGFDAISQRKLRAMKRACYAYTKRMLPGHNLQPNILIISIHIHKQTKKATISVASLN